jgi:hypothetical protein
MRRDVVSLSAPERSLSQVSAVNLLAYYGILKRTNRFAFFWKSCRNTYIHTYHSRFIPEGAAEVSQIFLRDTHVFQNKLAMRNTADVAGGKPIAVLLPSISGVSAINPLVTFYDIHGGKREVLFFYFVPDTTRDEYTY